MMRRMSPANGGGLVAGSSTTAVTGSFESSTNMDHTQRRSTVYFTHNFAETKQPKWLRHKEAPMMQYELYNYRDNGMKPNVMGWDKQKVESGHHNPLKHMNLWGDTDITRNHSYANFWETYQTYNKLIGRPTDITGWGRYYRTGWTKYETETDQRYQGMEASSAKNYFAPFGNDRGKLAPMYHPELHQPHGDLSPIPGVCGTQGKSVTLGLGSVADPQVKALAEKQYPHLKGMYAKGIAPLGPGQVRNFSKEETALYWKQLLYLINLHGDAVGEFTPGENRDITKVHQYFVNFQQAFSSFETQDTYLLNYLNETRPPELEDLYGIFLGMEINYLNQDYCPRCSLPFKTTEFCGEGAGHIHARFKKWRGRYKPHKPWGKEWFDVVANRAEQLWYRATEDCHFGQAQHTQLQAERLLDIYCRTQQRGRANTFVNRLYSSEEYLSGKIKWTSTMQKNYDRLLELTPHPHLLTGSYKHDGNLGGQLLGSSTAIPNSPHQIRVDLELAKVRREQKEEGVVKLPPKDYALDMKPVVGYQVRQGRIRNWKEVKQGIETSFLSSGLPDSAYHAADAREIVFLEDAIKNSEVTSEKFKAEFEADRRALLGSGGGKKGGFVFPDRNYYQCFDVSAKAFEPFTNAGLKDTKLQLGMMVRAQVKTFKNPAAIDFNDSTQGTRYPIDVRDESCEVYGFTVGTMLSIQGVNDAKPRSVVVMGVSTAGSNKDHALLSFDANTEEIINLGRDLKEVRNRWKKKLEVVKHHQPLAPLAAYRDSLDVMKGRVVGVRQGALWVQWNNEVASSLGTPADVSSLYNMKKTSAPIQDPSEPFSWNVPFRNRGFEERLAKAKEAPWRQGTQTSSAASDFDYSSSHGQDGTTTGTSSSSPHYVSIVPHKFTPKPKKFGYAQNDERGDFHTSEYKDRLKSRQFYTNSEKFQVLPDSRDKSVHFTSSKAPGSVNGGGGAAENDGGGNSYNRLAGLPSVDRNELDQGYLENVNAETRETGGVSATEVAEVEQALRDISGRRPGNFVKGEVEKNSLQLNESWFRTFHSGWKHHNEKQKLLPESERRLIDHVRLPFSGEIPPSGITMGIGERYQSVMNDWGKGFDIGPEGHGAGSDKSRFNQFNVSKDRSEALGKSNVLLRMFNEKFAEIGMSMQQFVCSEDRSIGCAGMDPKKMMLALNEWRHCGAAPSLMVLRMLSEFLAPEIDAYNQLIPAVIHNSASSSSSAASGADADRHKVHRIKIDHHLGLITQSAISAQSSFVDVDAFAFKMEQYAKDASATSIAAIGANLGGSETQSGGGGGFGKKGTGMRGPQLSASASHGEGFLQQAYVALSVKSKLNQNVKAPMLESYLVEEGIRNFNAVFGAAIGKDIPQDQQAAKQSASGGNDKLMGNKGFALQLITIENIEACLQKLGFDTDLRLKVLSGIDSDFVDKSQSFTITGTRFDNSKNTIAIPYSLLLNWKGPFTSKSSAGRSGSLGLGSSDSGNQAEAKGSSAADSSSGQGMQALMARMTRTHEGLVMDMQYKIRQNKKCPHQFAEFCRLAQFGSAAAAQGADVEATLRTQFDRYVSGTWVPDTEEATLMLTAFLKNLLAKDSKARRAAKSDGYLVASGSPGKDGSVAPLDVAPLPLDRLPFMFESGKVEHRNMVQELRGMGLSGSVGPEYEALRKCKLVKKGSTAYDYNTASGFGSGADRGAGSGVARGGGGPRNAEEVPGHQIMKTLQQDSTLEPRGTEMGHVFNSDHTFHQLCSKVMLRAFPLLPEWFTFATRAANEFDQGNKKVSQSRMGFRSLLEEMQRDMEAEFKQNSEKYWVRIMDHAGRDEGGRGGGGGSYGQGRFGGGGGGGGGRDGRDRMEQQKRSSRREDPVKISNKPGMNTETAASNTGAGVLESIGIGTTGSAAGSSLGPKAQKPYGGKARMMTPTPRGGSSSGTGGARSGSGGHQRAQGRGMGATDPLESLGLSGGKGRGRGPV